MFWLRFWELINLSDELIFNRSKVTKIFMARFKVNKQLVKQYNKYHK